MKKKKHKQPIAKPQSVVVRKQQPAMKFRQALNATVNPSRGRPPFKLNEIVKVLGDEFTHFVDACCDRRVTTRSIHDALRSLGVVISYETMMKIRKQIEGENRWFYDMVDDIVSNTQDGEGVRSEPF